MTFTANNQILLNPLWMGFFIALCGYIMLTGRPEWSAGIFLAMLGWTRNVMIGPIVHTYFLLAVTYGAILVRLYHRPEERFDLVPQRNRWIIVWMLCWWFWMLLLMQLFAPPFARLLRPSLVVFLIAPLPALLSFGNVPARITGFAYAFIATALVGGYQALAAIEIPLSALVTDPTLSGYFAYHLRIGNYHVFSYNYALSLIFIVALLAQTRSWPRTLLLMAAAGVCAQFLLLAGSRQSIGGALFALSCFSLWGLTQPRTAKSQLLLLVATVLLIGIPIYLEAPELVIRSGESGLAEAFDLAGDRGDLWLRGWEIFRANPLIGSAFHYVYSHNLLISTLAEQGLVGLCFFAGFFVFLLLQLPALLTSRGDPERAVWRMAFFIVILFGLTHSMASGSAISVRHIFWAATLLWWQSALLRSAAPAPAPLPTRLVGRAARVAS
jgi:hypothetical protein